MSARETTIITGASSGLGRELALLLARRGNNLVLAARREDRLAAVAQECRSLGVDVAAVPCDVTVQEDCRRLIETAAGAYGRIDSLINNAGVGVWSRFDGMTDLSVFRRVMDVNYFGAVYCTWYALDHLKRSRGQIIAISSLQGKCGFPDSTAYASSKHALEGFFDSLRLELADRGVRVLVAAPGSMRTELGTVRDNAGAAGRSDARECARRILRAAERGDRELVMTFAARAGLLLKRTAPGLADWVLLRALRRSAARRAGGGTQPRTFYGS